MRIISGKAKGKKLLIPLNKKTRPLKDMVRGAIFNIIHHSNLLNIKIEKTIVLDLFSGVGSFGLEALSRGAKKVVFFENFQPTLKLLYKNISNLSFNEKSEVNKKNVYQKKTFINLDYKFNLIFIDPPFKDNKVNFLLECLTDQKILSKKTLILIHRHRNTKDEFIKKFKIMREETYGSSKIIFGFIDFSES